MVERIAKVLNVPESYYYAKVGESDWLQTVFRRMPIKDHELLALEVRDILSLSC